MTMMKRQVLNNKAGKPRKWSSSALLFGAFGLAALLFGCLVLLVLVPSSTSINDQPDAEPKTCHDTRPHGHDNDPFQNGGASLLIVATVPQSKLHLQALWTMLECMSVGYDHVVVSAPTAARAVVQELRRLVEHLNIHPNLHVMVTHNNRYDVGLWCDALDMVRSKSPLNYYKHVTLVNDSVMMLRHTRVLLDRLESDSRYDLVGMSYSHTGGSFWIESYVRAFSARGIDAYYRHSCRLPPSHESFSTKRNVVDYHEIGLIQQYFTKEEDKYYSSHHHNNNNNDKQLLQQQQEDDKDDKNKKKLLAVGLYPGDLPEGWVGRGDANRTWVTKINLPYWKRGLLKGHFFPLAKVKMPQMIKWSTKHYQECKLSPATIDALPESLQTVGGEDGWTWKDVFAAIRVSD